MNEIKWEPAKITPRNIPNQKPSARITKNSLTFNAVAANLLENVEQYSWAEIYVGNIDDEPAILAFKFLREETAQALPVKKQSKNHKGITFFSRDIAKNYFNLAGIGVVFLQLDVEKLDDTTLGIRLLTEKNLAQDLGLNELEETLKNLL